MFKVAVILPKPRQSCSVGLARLWEIRDATASSQTVTAQKSAFSTGTIGKFFEIPATLTDSNEILLIRNERTEGPGGSANWYDPAGTAFSDLG